LKIIGHRGYSAKYPENTLAAFQAAMDVGADMIEFDVLLSKDSVPVIIHDDTLNRTTNGKGKVVDFTLDQLKKLDAGKGEAIPTLEEVMILAQKKIFLHIEIKSEAVSNQVKNGVEELVLALIEKYDLQKNCIISSFASVPLFRIRDLNPKIAVAHTFDHSLNDADKHTLEKLKPEALHLPIHKIKSDDMDYASVNKLPVNVYTVNSPVHMKSAQDLCVDGIFTNEVEKALLFFT
jgi:glycerophosphoryl diester phosphodiesterase